MFCSFSNIPILIICIFFLANVEDSELNACLLLLAYIINITPVWRKNSWKASRTEFRDGFITHVASERAVLTSIDERRIKLRDLGVTFQPLVIYCGESIKTIQKVFVVCETSLYEFQSLSKGVDTAFKIFHATGSQYPQESLWHLASYTNSFLRSANEIWSSYCSCKTNIGRSRFKE